MIAFLQSLFYWMSLILMAVSMPLTASVLIDLRFKKEKTAAIIAGISLVLTTIMFCCSLLYGLGYGNQTFLDLMYDLPNGGLPFIQSILLIVLNKIKINEMSN